MRHPELPERDRRILAALVQAYIDQGEPVSSLWLASRGFGVSSATLRNVLARLEELGYVRQPHTSAGRVPTDLGYRATSTCCSRTRRQRVRRHRSRRGCAAPARSSDLLSHVSQEVSRASHQVGFAIAPAAATTTLEHLDFVPLDGGKVLVVSSRPAARSRTRSSNHGALQAWRAAAGRQLPEQRVHGPLAARGAAGGPRAAARRTHAVRRADGARAAAREPTFEDIEPAPSLFIQGTSLLLEGSAARIPR